MAKEKKFSSLNLSEAQNKRREISSALIKFRVGGDVSHFEDKRGEAGLRQDLRLLDRFIARELGVSGGKK